ncbi:MAG: class I SAM-dependent methyltransferase [Gammaproteobacteria bacterium]|nr:class I SAM-dependent methyltransferase [Gammaproteobacteria bacterium]
MNGDNGYFKITDDHLTVCGGAPIKPDWWSRGYEYAWALRYADRAARVADMGCGVGKPLKIALARACHRVCAVDKDPAILSEKMPDNVKVICADFTQPIDEFPGGSLDRVFCISVLEHVRPDERLFALAEFRRVLKPDGLFVVTIDVDYDRTRPPGKYPGMEPSELIDLADKADLLLVHDAEHNRANVLINDELNLCCWHGVFIAW